MNDYQNRILRVLLYIEEHIERDVPINELAEVACFSIFHFHRVFKGMLGESVADYKRRLRIEWAAALLKSGSKSVTELAFEANFESVESFIRAFKKNFGITPLQFKKTYSLINEIPGSKRLEKRLMELINQRGEINMNVEIKKYPKKNVIAVRHTGPYKDCGQAWEKLCSFAGARNLLGPNSRFIGLCYDDPEITPADKIRYAACIEIESEIDVQDGVVMMEIPEGEYAMTLHKGPYDNLHETYSALCGEWLPEKKKDIRNAPSLEIYLNSPQEVSPEELLTEVLIPIE